MQKLSATLLYEAVQSQREMIVKMVLAEADCDPNTPISPSGYTSLMKASEIGNLSIISMLLNAGACINQSTSDGRTPLMLAAKEGHKQAVILLLSLGADKRCRAISGMTAKDVATVFDRKYISELL